MTSSTWCLCLLDAELVFAIRWHGQFMGFRQLGWWHDTGTKKVSWSDEGSAGPTGVLCTDSDCCDGDATMVRWLGLDFGQPPAHRRTC